MTNNTNQIATKWIYINKDAIFDVYNNKKFNNTTFKVKLSDNNHLSFVATRMVGDTKKNYAIANEFSNTVKIFIVLEHEYNIYDIDKKQGFSVKGSELINMFNQHTLNNLDNHYIRLGNSK